MRGKCLFELRPDLFPTGTMTDIERALWSKFFEELQHIREAEKTALRHK
jgi:hypothetical protein